MKKISKRKILIPGLLIFNVFLLIACSTPYYPVVDITLQNLIKNHWNKNMLQIEQMLPGGKLHKGNIAEKRPTYYFLKVKLTDINESASLLFDQSPEDFKEESAEGIIRRLAIECATVRDVEAVYKRICLYLNDTFPKLFTVANPARPYSAMYSLFDLNSKQAISIRIEKSIQKELAVRIDITFSKRIQVRDIPKE